MANTKIKDTLVNLLQAGQEAMVPAYGISMYPLLRPGDKLLVKPIKPRIGDIAVFDREDVLVAHRVYKIIDDIYLLKGDSLILADSPVHKTKILGIVTERNRGNKVTSSRNVYFRILKHLMPKYTFILGRPFHYYARLHQKLLRSLK